MPFSSVKVNPGVNTLFTPTLNEAGISASNLIRFRGGLPEKMGGWQKLIGSPMDSLTRALHAWADINGNLYLGAGNLDSVDAINGGAVTTITPQQLTSTSSAMTVATTRGSNIVTINDPNISNLPSQGAVFFNTPIAIGNIVLTGLYEIRPTPSGTQFTILADQPATKADATWTLPLLTTTQGSPTVLVTLTNHGVTTGGTFVFPIATVVGGVTISGVYKGCIEIDQDNFFIVANTQATATTSKRMNSDQVQFLYSLTDGPEISINTGAMGPLGQYAIGEGYVIHQSVTTQVGVPITATDWSFDNWGELLVACPKGGLIWYWSPTAGYTSMQPVGNGPPFNNGLFVAMPEQILVAWGSTSGINSANTESAQDKLIVRWSDQLDFTQWNVTATTQAGSFHIPTGSEIRGGVQGPGIALIFTDVDVWSMTYLGPPLVFGFNSLNTSGGLVGAHAVTTMRNAVYWMGPDNFYACTGGAVSVIPCTVWDNVYQDLDTANQSKCVAAANPDFSEVMFFYPSISGGTGECDKYVKVNVAEGYIWDYGTLARSAWQGRSLFGPPVGADPNTLYLQQHETGYSNDGSAMDSYYETGFFPVGDGENFAAIDELQPDAKFATQNSTAPNATITATLTAVNYPNSGASMASVLTLTSTTQYVTPRVRGRQAKWKVESNDATSWWRVGNLRYRYNVDGRR